MTSDINVTVATVVGIQNIPVSSNAPQDGYVLTYVSSNNDWEAKPITSGFKKDYFASSGSWTAPAGVTNVLIIAAGGGGGAGSGGSGTNICAGGTGGGGSIQITNYVEVIPGTTYTVTIGAGGVGGAGVNSANGNSGSDGSKTTFGTLFTALGGGKGVNGFQSGFLFANYGAGKNFAGFTGPGGPVGQNAIQGEGFCGFSYGGTIPIHSGANSSAIAYAGQPSPQGFDGGAGGGTIGTNNSGGSGGGGGSQGNGGDGSAGSSTSATLNGVSGGTNTGAGGGGSGGASGGFSSGNGGNGGSGYLYIIY